MKTLIVTAVEAEREAVLRGLGNAYAPHVIASGVGSLYAAIATMERLTQQDYDAVINLGIGGGFAPRAEIGSVVIADEVIAADWGAESPEGFLEFEQLGFGSQRIACDAERRQSCATALHQAGVPPVVGSILTVSATTGTEQTVEQLRHRFPQAAAEGMEGFGVAAVARHFALPFLEIRTISNTVGPRDRSSWRIKEALERLSELSSILQEGFQ